MTERGPGRPVGRSRTVRLWLAVIGAVAVTAAIAVPISVVRTRHPTSAALGTMAKTKAEGHATTRPTTGPHGTPVSDFGANGPDLWATTTGGELYVSTDGGTSWSATSTPVPLAERQRTERELVASNGQRGPYGITASGARVWLVAPTHGSDVLFESGDGGKSWSQGRRLPGMPRAGDDVSVQLLTTQAGFVAFSPPGTRVGRLDRSTDGGSTFVSSSLPARGAVHFDSPTVGFLVTSTGSDLYETTDAGTSWRRLTVHPAGIPDDVQVGFPLWATSGWAVVPVTVEAGGVGSLYTVAASADAGATVLGRLAASGPIVVSVTGDETFSSDGLLAYSLQQSWTEWTAAPQVGLPGGWSIARAVDGSTGSWILSEVRRSCPHPGTCSLKQILYRQTANVWQPVVLTAPPRYPPEGRGTPRLDAISFLSPTVGYGAFSEDGGCGIGVARTTDGGSRFSSPVEVGSCSRIGGTGSVTFDGSGDGFVSSSQSPLLYESHDGGHTWTSQLETGDIAAVETVGSSVWMLLADCPVTGSWPTARSTCPLVVRESTDGGRTWRTSPSQPQPIPPAAARGQIEKLTRVSQSSAYVLGTANTNGNAEPVTVPMWFTDDSGQSWSLRHLQCGIDASGASLAAAPTGTLFAVCAGDPGMGQQGKTVAVSDNGGLSWTHPGTRTSQVRAEKGLSGGYLGEVDAVSSTTAYFTGSRSRLFQTKDGGATWSAAAGPTDGTGGPTAVAFFGPDGVVLAGDSLWHTIDGGTSWAQVTPAVEH